MLKYYIKHILLNIIIFIIPISYAASTTTTNTPPKPKPLSPSEFQQNGTVINTLENGIQEFIKARETEDLNYGLHLIGFGGIKIDNPQRQFLTDYSRSSCNRNSPQNNLQECYSATTNYYTLIRPSNIFSSFYYQQPIELNSSIGVAHSLIDPFPSSQLNSLLKDQETASNPKNQEEIASLIAAQLPTMLAKNSINGIIARRYIDPETKQKLPTKYKNKAKSIMQLMHDESIRRLTDKDWFNNLNDLPVNQLLMELLQLEAFKLWVDYNKFQQYERIEALLATLLASQASQASAISSIAGPEAKEKLKENQERFKEIENSSTVPSF